MIKHYHPENFHGADNNVNFFEGWYFKHVSKNGDISISFIPGVSITENDSHAFIQVLYMNEDKQLNSHYLSFDYEDFSYCDNPFSVDIGKNHFSFENIIVDYHSDNLDIEAKLFYEKLTEIKKTILSPNIMGFFAYIPKMECNHGVLSMNHNIAGTVKYNEDILDFDDGKGYIEKDWGTSFPENYLWLQSNNFKESDTSFFCSLATIPFMGFEFKGLICNLVVDNKEYRFATYNNSKVVKHYRDDKYVYIKIKNNKFFLDINVLINGAEKLIAPDNGEMNKTVKEGLMGEIKIILRDKSLNKIYGGTGYNSGIEIR